MTEKYHFGVPAVGVWLSHIIIGLLLIFYAYNTMNNQKIHQSIHILVIVIGSIAILYHSHLWYYEKIGCKDDNTCSESEDIKTTSSTV